MPAPVVQLWRMHRPIGYVMRVCPASRRAGDKGLAAVTLNDRRFAYKVLLAAALVSAVGLSACGRKGALQAPPDAAVAEPDASSDASVAEKKSGGKPDRPFMLDGLL